ncbi:MAG: xanthine dehydrogenase family protein molybdopterin-binding subunit, partial [Desulfobacterales bacterium]|nr:xanthine dehydrogenase family protein molybdopterin-binding subunit [Desulfobacterales bacterium]
LAIGVYFGVGGERKKTDAQVWEGADAAFTPNAWLCIKRDDTVIVRVNHTEMGQGVSTALAMIVADELEADWSRVRVEIAPAEAVYKNPAFNSQLTAASTSVRTSWDPLRKAGASARGMLLSAAARHWSVPISRCRAQKGRVIHDASGRKIRFGELAPMAAGLPLPESVSLKRPDRFNLIGKPIPRLDTPEKTDGKAVFGIDVRMPGLLTATVVHPPTLGARLQSLDASRAKALDGVRHVLPIPGGVAVVADTFWQAKKGADSLETTYEKGEGSRIDSHALTKRWIGLAGRDGKSIHEKGDADPVMREAVETIRAVYELPFQAHVTPEPMNCTAHVQKDRCVLWAPTQNQDGAQEIAARITGLPYDKIMVNTPFVGGGFGRRVAVDYVAEAVEISKAVNAPVKVIWTREEDTRNDFYRPAGVNIMKAALDREGLPAALTHTLIGPDHMAQQLPPLIPSFLPYALPRGVRTAAGAVAKFVAPRLIPGKKASEGATPPAYDIPNVRVVHIHDDPGVPVGFWRSVAFSQNVFAVECFMDEIAAASGKDPFALRYALLSGSPRERKTLEMAERISGWRNKTAPGHSRGMAFADFHGALLCCVVEASVSRDGRIRVHRVYCVVDCGVVINPKIVKAQIQGGIVFGLTATIKSAITIEKGRVQQGNVDDFPLLRMDETPEITVEIIPSDLPPAGVGEASVPLIAPAAANAVFAATGKRVRRLPITPADLRS